MDKVRCKSRYGDKKITKDLTKIIYNSKDGVAEEATRQMKILWENLYMKCLFPLQLCYFLGADPTGLEESTRSECELRIFLREIKRIWNEERGGLHMNNNGDSPAPSKIFAVALDGGGIRGLVTGMILRFVSWRIFGSENGIKRKFQWFIGTSTGGIIALALTKSQEMTPTECVQLYWKLKSDVFITSKLPNVFSKIFQRKPPQQTQGLERTLADNFSEDECLEKYSKEISPRVSVTTLNITKKPATLMLLRNYDIQVDGKNITSNNWSLIDMALATSAAPTHFKQFHKKQEIFVDGGLSVNCPLSALFCEIDRLYKIKQQPDVIGGILSIGTGSKTIENRPEIREKKQLGILSVIDLLADQATGADQHTIEFTKERCKSADFEFLRLCPENVDLKLDSQNDKDLLSMLMNTLLYLSQKENLKKIDNFAQVYGKCLVAADETDHLFGRNGTTIVGSCETEDLKLNNNSQMSFKT